MADAALCHYALIRYVADPDRDEARNIGVIVLAPDAQFARARIAFSRTGLSRSSHRFDVIRSLLRSYQLELAPEMQLSLWGGTTGWTPSRLLAIHQESTGLIRFGAPAVARKEPNRLIEDLFERLVVTPHAKRAGRPLSSGTVAHALRRAFAPLGKADWVEEDAEVILNEDSLEFDVVVRNGKLYYAMETVSFRGQDLQRAEEAGGWFAHVWPNVAKATGAVGLMVIESPTDADGRGRRRRVSQWAEQAGIEVVDSDKIRKEADRLAAQVKALYVSNVPQ